MANIQSGQIIEGFRDEGNQNLLKFERFITVNPKANICTFSDWVCLVGNAFLMLFLQYML